MYELKKMLARRAFQLSFCLLVITGPIIIMASRYPNDTSSAGDVVYSILDPDHFYTTHDKSKWALLDGRNINGSDLTTLGVHKIPDARGVFIRAMDLGRNDIDGKGDPDSHTRNVTDIQMDGLKSHQHNFQDAYFSEIDCGGNHGFIGASGNDHDNSPCKMPNITDAGIGTISETRPKNIALYIYIRINN